MSGSLSGCIPISGATLLKSKRSGGGSSLARTASERCSVLAVGYAHRLELVSLWVICKHNRQDGSSRKGIARGCQQLGWLLIDRGQIVLAESRSKTKNTLIHLWLQHPSTRQGCAKAAFLKADDIAAESTDRADTQAGRQASRQEAHIHRQELGYHSVKSDTSP